MVDFDPQVMLQPFIAGTSELELETVDDVTSELGTEIGKRIRNHALACWLSFSILTVLT